MITMPGSRGVDIQINAYLCLSKQHIYSLSTFHSHGYFFNIVKSDILPKGKYMLLHPTVHLL